MLEILFLFTVCFLGSMIQAVTGFGFAIVAMPLLTLILPFKTAATTVTVISFILACQMAYRLRANINIRIMVAPLITTVLGRTLGVYILQRFDAAVLSKALGVFLVLLAMWFVYANGKFRIKAKTSTGLMAGLISGIFGGSFNIGGPPIAVYYFSALESKEEYNSTTQATFALSIAYNLLLHIIYGNVSMQVLKFAAVGILAIILGSTIGIAIFCKINKGVMGKIIYSFIAVMGIMLFVR